MYDALKFIHVLGIIILIGNVTITAFWKVLSDRTDNRQIIRFAQRGVIVADWIFTLAGIAMILIGGYGAAWLAQIPIFGSRWLVAGQILFAISGLIWLIVLVPLQMRQRSASDSDQGELSAKYQHDAQSWLRWGIAATIPLVAAIWVMIAKP